MLPRHQVGGYGCGPDNPAGFGLEVIAAPGGGVRAELTFDDRYLAAEVQQHDELEVTSTARFRVISPERMANRYERVDR